MPTVESLLKAEFENMTQEQKTEYCDWCWDKTCASCYDCFIELERKSRKSCCEHKSDCAVHNEPAMKNGECNCK